MNYVLLVSALFALGLIIQGFKIRKLKKQINLENGLRECFLSLARDSFWGAIAVCQLKPEIIGDASYDIESRVTKYVHALVKRKTAEETQGTLSIESQLESDINKFKNPNVVSSKVQREGLLSALAKGLTEYAEGHENGKQTILEIYNRAMKEDKLGLCTVIHDHLIVAGVIPKSTLSFAS